MRPNHVVGAPEPTDDASKAHATARRYIPIFYNIKLNNTKMVVGWGGGGKYTKNMRIIYEYRF